ncbi:unnamed protein product [Diatraea saccharalis]|uniref:Uncharacterized protein n=1 Tax=Diatraea saccharalis TaxID=40085 RepID=A0A9N9W8J0_9NEOP|nr:unnamed protein product [Diatraea saccharalis]
MTEPEDLNFTAFTDLCRLCSLKSGPRLHIFDKESEQRQILFKLRTCLPTMKYYVYREATGNRSEVGLFPESLQTDIEGRFPAEEDLRALRHPPGPAVRVATELPQHRLCAQELRGVHENCHLHH